jgi:TRAP-type transport system periplasmic protein
VAAQGTAGDAGGHRLGSAFMADREASLLAELETAGMTVVTPDAAGIEAAARPAIGKLFTTTWNVTM